VRVALEFAAHNRNTLVIVTGDHGHTARIVEADATPAGYSSILVTNEGEEMMVTYGTTAGDPRAVSQQHTGTQIRVAARGPQAANVVGLIDQTDLFQIMARAIGAAKHRGGSVKEARCHLGGGPLLVHDSPG
jgi:alkaline phosphatase